MPDKKISSENFNENDVKKQIRTQGVAIDALPGTAGAQLDDLFEIQRGQESLKITAAQVLSLSGQAGDVYQNQDNYFTQANTFKEPISVGQASADHHAARLSDVHKIDLRQAQLQSQVGHLAHLETQNKQNLVQAVNEIVHTINPDGTLPPQKIYILNTPATTENLPEGCIAVRVE